MLTRQEAVAEMIDGAIGAWIDGRLACAITLAGAAEDGMPRAEGGLSTFEAHRDMVAKFGRCSAKEATTFLREEKNWLKHFSEDKSDTISTEHAWVHVVRAYAQFRLTYPGAVLTENMKDMDARVLQHVGPVLDIVRGVGAFVQRMVQALVRALPPPSKN